MFSIFCALINYTNISLSSRTSNALSTSLYASRRGNAAWTVRNRISIISRRMRPIQACQSNTLLLPTDGLASQWPSIREIRTQCTRNMQRVFLCKAEVAVFM